MWEYQLISTGSAALGVEEMQLRLNALGALGWEAVGVTANDPTIGLNSLVVVLKRQVTDWPAPDELDAGWRPDPTGRFPRRYWDGERWTEHAEQGGERVMDLPNRRS